MNEFRFICARLILDERVLKILSVTERHTYKTVCIRYFQTLKGLLETSYLHCFSVSTLCISFCICSIHTSNYTCIAFTHHKNCCLTKSYVKVMFNV